MAKNENDRFNQALNAKLEPSISAIFEELNVIKSDSKMLDISFIKSKLEKKIADMAKSFEQDKEFKMNGHIALGTDAMTSPPFFTKAFIYREIAWSLEELIKIINELCTSEIDKIHKWGKEKLDSDVVINFDTCTIQKDDSYKNWINLLEQIMERDLENLKSLYEKIEDNPKGEKKFINDCIEIRLTDALAEGLISDLLKCQDTEEIITVCNSDVVKETKWGQTIRFIGGQLVKYIQNIKLEDSNNKEIEEKTS